MLVDTHCHMNMMIKNEFDTIVTIENISKATPIIEQAHHNDVLYIINVGTSLIESKNCVELAKTFQDCFATVGIHPNDCTSNWLSDFKEIRRLWFTNNKKPYKDFKIVGIGECGLDRHYPDYNLQRQQDAFKAQIELALEYDLALSIHTRDAGDETLKVLDIYRKEKLKGVIHCFSEDQPFAREAIDLGFVLGIGGTLTYPKNNQLRTIVATLPLEKIILETDAPFLPPQPIRGKQNNPAQIATVAHYLAGLRNICYYEIASVTSLTACTLFNLPTKTP